MADLENDRIRDNETKRRKKEAQDAARKNKKKKRDNAEKEREIKARETNTKLLDNIKQKGIDHIMTLTVNQLKDLLRYHFGTDHHKDKDLRKDDFRGII